MPINIKPTDQIAAKFAARAAAAGADYKSGVLAPKAPQADSAIAAAGVWAQAIADAAARGAFAAGLQRSGNEKWQRKASTVGAARYPQGVQAAAPDYSAGVAKFFDVLRNLTLPPRNIKGQNMARVQAVVDALRKAKQGG